MAKHSLLSRFKRHWLASRRSSSTKGFTLLELLVVTMIAGGIVAGLTYIVVELMGADQREASRSETQREMQMALDYMGNEMREAVYVYTGDYLECGSRVGGGCQKFTNFLPTTLSDNSVPVVAFWKYKPFPPAIQGQCAGDSQPENTACLAGQSYALVVYSLSRANSGIWKGKARITRYELSQFDSDGNPTTGYVNPATNNNLATWPYGVSEEGGTTTNLQAGRPTGSSDVLVDYVDDSTKAPGATGQTGACPNDPTTSGDDYAISPSAASLTAAGLTNVRSFYACVSVRPTSTTTSSNGTTTSSPDLGVYQDVILYVRGNASGRPGIFSDTAFLPTLETRVLNRGVLNRTPN
jgi:prepilin-type N-terminal cleavage/methylation domain-containing protein